MKNNNKHYKVVKIIDSETIIVNIGSDDDVSLNQELEILGNEIPIVDPDTKEILGKIKNVKETVSILEIYPKMSICSHIVKRIGLTPSFDPLNNFINRKILNVDKEEILKSENEDKTIKIGDLVIIKEQQKH